MTAKTKGRLIIIGGHEDKEGSRVILEAVCSDAAEGKGSLVIVTAASQEPEKLAKKYVQTFQELGVKEIEWLDIRERADANSDDRMRKLERASVLFFTGGDQLRITSQIGDTALFKQMNRMIENGITIAGTSAGAAAMSDTMIVGGPGEESDGMSALAMASGLGLFHGAVIDPHFAERGRITRLLSAVVQNPRNLGLGIDEDTAIVTDGRDSFHVIGSGAVYVADGSEIEYSSLSQDRAEGVISIFGVKLHVLASGDGYDLANRRPVQAR